MLKITLKQFLGISGLVEDTMDKFNISYDLTPYVELYIGDPDKNGNIVIDYKGPRGLFNDDIKRGIPKR